MREGQRGGGRGRESERRTEAREDILTELLSSSKTWLDEMDLAPANLV